MRETRSIEPLLLALGGRTACYQMLQLIVISLGSFGAAYQLLDNIFIGRAVIGQQCSAPSNSSVMDSELQEVDWNSSHVVYDKCEITVSAGNLSNEKDQSYSCIFGYSYGYPRELSFRTEFDLVCDRELLGSLTQTLVVIGQGIGAVLSSMVSDRFGRKRTLVGSQFGLLVVGMAIGFAPSYPVLGALKFLVGGLQQGVVTGIATMTIELYPMEHRSITILVSSLGWSLGACSMTLSAYLLRNYTWRYLQYTLSAISLPICLIQLWYLDESLRWLVANGRKEDAISVLERAARVNHKDINTVLQCLHDTDTKPETNDGKNISGKEMKDTNGTISKPGQQPDTSNAHVNPAFSDSTADLDAAVEEKLSEQQMNDEKKATTAQKRASISDPVLYEVEQTLSNSETEKMTILDIFKHRHLLVFASVAWLAWFTVAFSYFSLYMMSTSLHGDRFVNYFLTALMELPAGLVFYFLVDRVGRKPSIRGFFIITGLGLIISGVSRIFQDNSGLKILSVVTAMAGMLGASSLFGAVFFVTPELFPTNMRNQALGLASFAGRLGGMFGPFMADLAKVAIWAPGAIISSFCFLVVILFRFIPETKGKELPSTIEDIKSWNAAQDKPETINTKL